MKWAHGLQIIQIHLDVGG